MAERVTRQAVAEKAIVHSEAALLPPHVVDRSFEMPTALYAAVAALFLGFMAVTGIGFATRELILPVGVIVLFIVGFFGEISPKVAASRLAKVAAIPRPGDGPDGRRAAHRQRLSRRCLGHRHDQCPHGGDRSGRAEPGQRARLQRLESRIPQRPARR